MKQIGVWAALGIWAVVCVGGALYASWQGYGGRAFAATLTTFAFLLLVTLLLAARGVAERIASRFGPGGGLFLGAIVFLVYLIYLLGTGAFGLARAGATAGLVFVPLGLAIWADGTNAGVWQDFLIILGVWVFVKFSPSHWLWPYPGGRLAYVMTVLVAVSVALASFLLVRRLKGTGYSIGWGNRWSIYAVGSFLAFACAAIPLAIELRFIVFAPQWHRWSHYVWLSVAIFLFTAWPEELLFRGLLQNCLARASRSDLAGWWTASVLFGFSHITNQGFPNWKYVILATIAGLFYGWTWRKTGSIFASALVHTAVDAVWHFLFRTM
ncbi:MAG TPA: type II CAAX endopeptidase family protein [Candidatus Limnocylindrales bacterium]|nr:type II CAAX endopeptidase family protein [Candidatus Limnocylindrales bacterium]